jgi:hypothetical protein
MSYKRAKRPQTTTTANKIFFFKVPNFGLEDLVKRR